MLHVVFYLMFIILCVMANLLIPLSSYAAIALCAVAVTFIPLWVTDIYPPRSRPRYICLISTVANGLIMGTLFASIFTVYVFFGSFAPYDMPYINFKSLFLNSLASAAAGSVVVIVLYGWMKTRGWFNY